MKEFTVPMARADLIPVVLYLIGVIVLYRKVCPKMSRGIFVLFAAGTVDVTAAGALKALYKLLYALGVCDFEALSKLFMPLQALGFLLAGIAMVLFVFGRKKQTLLLAAPPLFGGTVVFIVMMVLGLAAVNVSLAVLAAREKKRGAVILFLVSLLCSVCMGYLSSQDFAQAAMNWLAEGVNIAGQGTFLLGAISLCRK